MMEEMFGLLTRAWGELERYGTCRLGKILLTFSQYGGSPVKVGEEEYALFRDHE